MGTFNSIIIPWVDPVSNADMEIEVQFRYGDVWQYRYRIGDQIRWGGNDVGDPSEPAIVTFGWPLTLEFGQPEYFEVYIVNTIIAKVLPWQEKLYWGEKDYLPIDPDEV